MENKGYAVVIGANEIAASVIHNLFTERKEGEINYRCEGNNRYVILQTSRDAQKIRDELAVHLSEAEIERVTKATKLFNLNVSSVLVQPVSMSIAVAAVNSNFCILLFFSR